jgi:hypothetical protein
LITQDVHKIPERHIMKRWTVDARDILPDHIKHYQKDMGPPEASTFRHSAMYITALEVVQLGDINPEAFECMMNGLCELKAKAASLGIGPDGKSMLEKSKASSISNLVVLRKTKDTRTKSVRRNGVRDKSAGGSSIAPGETEEVADNIEVTSVNNEANLLLLALERRLKRGRPSTGRDRPPYEENNKRSRFCSICREKGHRSTTCPSRGDRPVKPWKEPQCSNCGLTGHRKTSCAKPLYSCMTRITVGGIDTGRTAEP